MTSTCYGMSFEELIGNLGNYKTWQTAPGDNGLPQEEQAGDRDGYNGGCDWLD